MTDAQALELAAMTRAFYDAVAQGFSATRERAWDGWGPVFVRMAACGKDRLSVLDVASGNLRFERALADRMPEKRIDALCLDACEALADETPAGTDLRSLDIMAALADGTLIGALEGRTFDCAVSFGFMHHIPRFAWRVRLLETLAASLNDGGLGVASFWRLGKSPRLMSKAVRATERADIPYLDEHDYVLGWQDRCDVLRYCHDFTSREIDLLVQECSDTLKVIDIWDADGREGNLNRYVAFTKRSSAFKN